MRPASLLAATAFLFIGAEASICYGSSGNEDVALGICDPSETVSACCNLGDYCYSNGLCQQPGVTTVNSSHYTIYYIVGCTNTTSSANGCYVYEKCIGLGTGITSCGDDKFCCYGLGGCDCTTSNFTLDSGTIITSLPATAAATSSSSTATTKSSTTSAATTTTAATTSTAVTVSSSSSSSSNSTAIGAGVGVGVGVLLLLALGFWFWRRRRNRRNAALAGKTEDHHGHPNDPKYGPNAPPGYAPAPQHESFQDQPTAEMDGSRAPVQLDGRSMVKGPDQQHGPSELAAD